MAPAPFRIAPAMTAADITAIADLFRAYAASLPFDLGYQGFEAELAGLPGKYAPPAGALLLARGADGTPLGSIALRPMDEAGIGEVKRLYVVPEGRGLGLGQALIAAVLDVAQRAGYRRLYLDTHESMTAAIALYRGVGFGTVEAYYDTPLAGTIFMALDLGDRS